MVNILSQRPQKEQYEPFSKAQFKEGKLAPLSHTDRGAAYTSKLFNQYLAINGASHSYLAPGTPAYNAVIEH